MHDLKNILLAWTSSVPTVFVAAETNGPISLLSAVILPIIFFTLGKTIDVLLQLHFRRRDRQSVRQEVRSADKSVPPA